MVTLVPANLRAAREERGWSISELAEKLGKEENRQTIHHLLQGDVPVRCRAERRKNLAAVLEVPEEWLAGQPFPLPIQAWIPVGALLSRSPRVALATALLVRQCAAALKRDTERYRAEPDIRDGRHSASGEVIEFVVETICSFTNPLEWRHALLRDAPPRLGVSHKPSYHLYATGESLTPRHVEASLGLIKAFAFMLQPWFAGDLAMKYDRYKALFSAMRPDTVSMMPRSDPPDRIIGLDGRTFPIDSTDTPYAALHWPPPEGTR
jgi:transcriptional regulator with XRE-family HTH domain